MAIAHKISTNLWFNNQAEEAARFYLSIFKNSKIGRILWYGKEGFEYHHKPEGTLMTFEFEIEGKEFVALNGGPEFQFTEAVSFIINCETQEEVDYYWGRLSEGGDEKAQVCGWLKDKFGVSWQIVPVILNEMLEDHGDERGQRAARAMFQMKKLDIETLQRAYNGEEEI